MYRIEAINTYILIQRPLYFYSTDFHCFFPSLLTNRLLFGVFYCVNFLPCDHVFHILHSQCRKGYPGCAFCHTEMNSSKARPGQTLVDSSGQLAFRSLLWHRPLPLTLRSRLACPQNITVYFTSTSKLPITAHSSISYPLSISFVPQKSSMAWS